MTVERDIVIGTRGSELARTQARLVEESIQAARRELNIETRIIVTKGDGIGKIDQRAGWKGLFTAEIERALLAGEVDLAVHSAKDLPSQTNPGTEIGAVLQRGLTNDVLISKHPGGIAGLPNRAIVGTSSVRRIRQLKRERPDLSIVDLRGNVPTRLRKLAEQEWDAIVLAQAGLDRLNASLQDFFAEPLSQDSFVPAGGQGIIAIQIRSDDARARAILGPVNDPTTLSCLRAEREFLRLLNVDCNAPVGVLARIDGGLMKMRAQYFRDDSATPDEGEVEGPSDQGQLLATQLMDRLRLRS